MTYWALWVLVLGLEWWLGKTNRVRAASIVELIWNLVEWVSRRRNVAIAARQVNVAKELDDCLALVVKLIQEIKDGKKPGEIASDLVPALIAAVNGIEGVPDEWKANHGAVFATVGLRVAELTALLTAPKAP